MGIEFAVVVNCVVEEREAISHLPTVGQSNALCVPCASVVKVLIIPEFEKGSKNQDYPMFRMMDVIHQTERDYAVQPLRSRIRAFPVLKTL